MSLGQHECFIPVRLKETAWDHVYFGTVFTWFEVGRTELSRAAGMPYVELTRRGIGNFVTHAGATYHKPIPFTGTVRAVTRLASMSRVKFTFVYELYPEGADSPAVTGYTQHACADDNGRLTRLPDDFRDIFAESGEEVSIPGLEAPEPVSWTHNLRVRYEETDAFRIGYNGNYFAWMEAAWSERLMGGQWDVAESIRAGKAFAVAETHCRYISPVTYDDPVAITVGGQAVGRTRVQLNYEMRHAETNAVVALGRTLHAFTVDGRPTRIPEGLLDALGITR